MYIFCCYNNTTLKKVKSAEQAQEVKIMKKINVTIWNEFIHEREEGAAGDLIRSIYPDGIHNALAANLNSDDLNIRAVSLDMPSQGLPDELLGNTDVLVWWGHCGHALVEDSLVDRIQSRILHGMGLVVLHSGHLSKIFRRMTGTQCRLRWREVGEKERVWTVDPSHPVACGVPESFVIPHTEMYGEPFNIPDDGKVVFMSWYEGGNVFRSGVAFLRDAGKIFYFSPGHETFPIYHDENVIKIIGNAVRWAAPVNGILPDRKTPQPEAHEKITTENPLAFLNTADLHKSK